MMSLDVPWTKFLSLPGITFFLGTFSVTSEASATTLVTRLTDCYQFLPPAMKLIATHLLQRKCQTCSSLTITHNQLSIFLLFCLFRPSSFLYKNIRPRCSHLGAEGFSLPDSLPHAHKKLLQQASKPECRVEAGMSHFCFLFLAPVIYHLHQTLPPSHTIPTHAAHVLQASTIQGQSFPTTQIICPPK